MKKQKLTRTLGAIELGAGGCPVCGCYDGVVGTLEIVPGFDSKEWPHFFCRAHHMVWTSGSIKARGTLQDYEKAAWELWQLEEAGYTFVKPIFWAPEDFAATAEEAAAAAGCFGAPADLPRGQTHPEDYAANIPGRKSRGKVDKVFGGRGASRYADIPF